MPVCARSVQIFLLNANDFLLNANQTDGAKGADGAKGTDGARGGAEKGRKNERRAKLTKWGG